jgi:hypothetical protein
MKYQEVFYTSVWRLKDFKLRFRFDPIPYSGKYKGIGFGYRNIKTTQERKYSCDPEHKPYIRGKRSFRNLPEAWDDIPAFPIKRSWKRTKKRKQWM